MIILFLILVHKSPKAGQAPPRWHPSVLPSGVCLQLPHGFPQAESRRVAPEQAEIHGCSGFCSLPALEVAAG